MKKTTVRVIISDSGVVDRHNWPGYLSSTPGLAITREVSGGRGENGELQPADNWTITHIESGYAVDFCHRFTRRKDAEEMAKYLGQFCDWTIGKDEILQARPFRYCAKEVAAKGRAIMAAAK